MKGNFSFLSITFRSINISKAIFKQGKVGSASRAEHSDTIKQLINQFVRSGCGAYIIFRSFLPSCSRSCCSLIAGERYKCEKGSDPALLNVSARSCRRGTLVDQRCTSISHWLKQLGFRCVRPWRKHFRFLLSPFSDGNKVKKESGKFSFWWFIACDGEGAPADLEFLHPERERNGKKILKIQKVILPRSSEKRMETDMRCFPLSRIENNVSRCLLGFLYPLTCQAAVKLARQR